jgi:serpin B
LDFKNDLEKLGIVSAFNPGTANFSKLTTSRLYVNDAIHKASINFSESGIEAAAVTSFSLDITSAADSNAKEPIYLNFDHPFLFLIRDRSTGTPWFTGTVYIPSVE